MIVGPTAIGKSAIMNKVIELDTRFGRVGGFTTRLQRPNDEAGLYRYLSNDAARQIIEQGEAVQFAINPANDQIYGTQAIDYASEFNMKDTLSGAVAGFMNLPFQNHMTISVTASTEAWKTWLDARFPEPSADRTRRLIEAKQSIEWSLNQKNNHAWAMNTQGSVDKAASSLISYATGTRYVDSFDEPRKMLRLIDDLLSYE